jgi:hypothetical protein
VQTTSPHPFAATESALQTAHDCVSTSDFCLHPPTQLARTVMAGPLGTPNAQFSASPYMHPFRPASSMSANRFDEGYSEDTRSQNEGDMVMRSDVQLTDSEMGVNSPFVLPDWVMALSEHERSGK